MQTADRVRNTPGSRVSHPLPNNETQRLQVLRDLQVLDSLPQKIFDNITVLAANICGAPAALISLVDKERVWFKARLGYEGTETLRGESICSHAIMESDRVFVVNDASTDARFAAFPLVKSGKLGFYAGAPMTTSGGHTLGVVCVLDPQPRELNPSQIFQLQRLADLAMSLIENESHRKQESHQVLDLVRRNERIIRSVLDEGHEMCSFIDRQHRFQFVNPAHEAYWNQPRESLVGMHVQDLVGDRLYGESFKDAIHRALSGQETRLALTHEFPGAGLRHMDVRHIPARDDEGVVFGVVERFRDVTELTEQARTLRDHVKELDSQRLAQRNYLHLISHDLKEPINAINNAAPLLSTSLGEKLAPLERRCLNYITRGGLRMAQLVEDLRLFSEMETEGLRVASHPADVLLKNALEHLADEQAARPVRLDMNVSGTMQVNAGAFELAMRYLVETLLRASPVARPHLSLDLTHGAGQCVLRLVGPSQEPHLMALTLLARAHAPATGSALPESPLGLSIAQHIVKAHGGTLCEEPTSEGGRCYTITLPFSSTE